MSNVIILSGISGSGKSTVALKINNETGAYIISTDEFREIISGDVGNQECSHKAFIAAENTLEYLLRRGKDVILDATSLKAKYRKKWIEIAKKYNAAVYGIVLTTPKEVCLDRDSKRDRKVGAAVIERQFEMWVKPTVDEGFEEILEINN